MMLRNSVLEHFVDMLLLPVVDYVDELVDVDDQSIQLDLLDYTKNKENKIQENMKKKGDEYKPACYIAIVAFIYELVTLLAQCTCLCKCV